MKKLLLLFILVGISTNINLVEAARVVNTTSGEIILTDTVFLKTVLVNQDPTTAVPGEYVDLLFKAENWGTEDAKSVIVELLPQYPFSLDPGTETTKELGTIRGLQTGDNAFLFKYTVKVDEYAVEGENEIKLKYSYDAIEVYKTFNVTVSDSKTDFEVIVQDSTTSSTTLAIANIGANTAYSIIVKVPEQEGFRVVGTSASIIGNLDAGDYTLASFQISKVSSLEEKDFIFEISYTDILGIRRTIQKEISFDFKSDVQITADTFRENRPQAFSSNGLFYIAIGIVGVSVIILIIKFRKRKKK